MSQQNQKPKRERLEVAEHAHLRGLINELQNPASTSTGLPNRVPTRPGPLPPPPAALMDRLKAFLPQMAAANAQLEQQIKQGATKPEDYDIEVLTNGEEEPHIEMDVALGVLDLKSEDAVRRAELLAQGQEMLVATGEKDDESESDSDSDQDGACPDEDEDGGMQVDGGDRAEEGGAGAGRGKNARKILKPKKKTQGKGLIQEM